MPQIFVFGDSIAYGAWDTEGGWVQRLRKYLDSKVLNENKYFILYNLGISGDDSSGILKRFEVEMLSRQDSNEESIIIFDFGSNDSVYNNEEETNKISTDEFRKNVNELMNLSKEFSSKIIFMSPPPSNDSLLDPIPWLPGNSYKNSEIKKYGSIIEYLAEKNDILFIDLFNMLLSTDYIKNLLDRIHPNNLGHDRIFDIVKDVLENNKFI